MDDWFRQSCMKQMGWRPSMNKRKSEPIRRPLGRVRIMLFRLQEAGIHLNKRTFAATVTRLRKRAGMTQSVLASRLHVSDKTISKWETGVSQT